MAKTLRNQYDKYLTYENLMNAHLESRKGKNLRKETILFNLKQEDYIKWLYEKLKDMTYKHRRLYIFLCKRTKSKISRKI